MHWLYFTFRLETVIIITCFSRLGLSGEHFQRVLVLADYLAQNFLTRNTCSLWRRMTLIRQLDHKSLVSYDFSKLVANCLKKYVTINTTEKLNQ